MSENWIIGAQVSTSHSSLDSLTLDAVLAKVERVRSAIDLDVLVIGARESPEIFRGFCAPGRGVDEVFLWYNVLSDIDGMEDSDLVVNWRGERSGGWGGWSEKEAEVSETFRFVCPNNPVARAKALGRLRELLTRYAFSGAFLDKVRFPSPANGLEEVASCFCEHCRSAAKAIDLDLEELVRIFDHRILVLGDAQSDGANENEPHWLFKLAAANPLLDRFLRFRMDSITSLVAEAYEVVSGLGRRIAADLFSPGLAPLVGQDYRALARYCDWIKPMTYRVAEGPAGLRLEIPALAEGISRMFGVREARVSEWAARHVPGFDRHTLQMTRDHAVPLPLIMAEIASAVKTAHPVPIYFGLELVRHPGVVDVTPELVREMIQAGRQANAAGLVISWDLMHAPTDGIETLATEIR
jgi:hypothetical protein